MTKNQQPQMSGAVTIESNKQPMINNDSYDPIFNVTDIRISNMEFRKPPLIGPLAVENHI